MSVPPRTDPTEVLLVEDNPGDAYLVQTLLEQSASQPLRFIHVMCLADAYDCLEKRHIGAVLLDLSLPDSSGVEAITHIRETDRTVPLVVLTGNDDERVRDEATRLGAVDYLCKNSLDGFRLARTLEAAIARTELHESLEQAQQAAAINKAQLLELLLMSFEPVLVVSDDKQVLFANRAASNLLGVPGHQLLGTRLSLPLGASPSAQVELVDPQERARPMVVRSFEVSWEDTRAHLVLLREPPRRRAPEPVDATGEELETVLASTASSISGHNERLSASFEGALDLCRKMQGLLAQAVKNDAIRKDYRQLFGDLLVDTERDLKGGLEEVDSIRTKTSVLLRHGRTSVHRHAVFVDDLVRTVCRQVRRRTSGNVWLKFRAGAPDLPAWDASRLAEMLECLLFGVIRGCHEHASIPFRLQMRTSRSHESLLIALEVMSEYPDASFASTFLESLVQSENSSNHELARANEIVRTFGGDTRFGVRGDHSIWIEVKIEPALKD